MTGKQKILIVDDRRQNLLALRRVLSGLDIEFIEATDGNGALAATLEHDFAVAILDVQMPGMDGYELAEHLRGDDKTKVIPIVFVTASNADEQHVFQGYEAGGIDYIVKPYEPAILLGKVRVFLELDRHRTHLEELVQERTAEALHLNSVLRAIRDVNQLIVREQRPDVLIQAACDTLVRSRGIRGVWIVLTEVSRNSVDGAHAGLDAAAFSRLLDSFRAGEPPTCCRGAPLEASVVVTHDTSDTCRGCPLAEAYPGNGVLTAALRYGGRHYGFLAASVPPRFADDEEEGSLIAEIAGDIAFALHKIEIERQRDQYVRIVANAQDAMALVDRDYMYLEANPSFEALVRRPAAEIVGASVAEVVGEGSFRQTIKPHLDRCLAGEDVRYETTRDAGGTGPRAIAVRYSPCLDADGSIGAVAVCIRDVTDIYEAQQRIEQLSRFPAENPNPVLRVSREGQVLYANAAAAPVLEALGVAPGGNVADAWGESLGKAAEAGQPWRTEMEIAEAVFDVTFGSVPENGYINVYMREITEGRRAEEARLAMEVQLRQSQKLESIGTLAGGVAHEINNPINGIMNYAQIIKDDLDGDTHAELVEFAGEIIHETKRVATIVRNLLAFARQDKQGHSPARIPDIVQGTLSLVRTVLRHDQVTLEVDVPEDLPKVKCRSQQIQQVLMNLLTNARDALNEKHEGYHEDKVIRVSAGCLEEDGQAWCRLTIEDHGTGIPDEVRERMFDPFYTSKPRDQGTGLGLSISHGIVRDHGGRLEVETELGQWTRIHLHLPVDNGWALEP